MAYKNTEGNSSIANQMGTWRYFNSSLEKLGTYKPATISVSPSVKPPQQEVDWADAAWGAAKGAMGLFQARRQASYKKADDYLKTHSIDEYRQAMAKGAIPFQDDPLAMQRLKYNHGKIVFQLSEQDFLAKVERGDFIGLQPEQVDAKHFEHSRAALQEVKNSFAMFNPDDDYWFNQGFYSDSPKTRVNAVLKNTQVANDALVKQTLVQAKAKVQSLINSGATPQQLLGAVDQYRVSLGNRLSIQQADDLTKWIVDSAANSRGGVASLQALRGYKILGADVTFQEYLGKDTYDAYLIKANSYQRRSNATDTYLLQDKIQGFVSTGQSQKIRAMRDDAVRKTGNVITPQVEYLNGAYLRALNVQSNKNGQLLKQEAKKAQSTFYSAWFNDVIQNKQGTPTQQYVRKTFCPNLTDLERKVIQQQYVQGTLLGDDVEKKRQLLNALSSKSAPYQARSVVADFLKDQWQDLNNAVFQAVKTGQLPVAVGQNGQPLPDYEYKIPGQATSKSIKYMPKSFRTLLDLYSLDPSAVTQLVGSSDQRLWEVAQQADLAIRMGQNPMRFIVQATKFQQLARSKIEQSPGSSAYKRPTFNLNKNEIYGLQQVNLVNPAINDSLAAVARVRAIRYLQKKPSSSLKAAYTKAQKQVASEFIGVQNFIIPVCLMQNYTPKGAKLSVEQLADASKSVFEDYMKKNGLSKRNDYANSYYDVRTNSIIIVSDVGYNKGTIPMDQFGNTLKAHIQNQVRSFFNW